MKVKLLPASETAYMLRRALGPVRSWDDCLADMRRDKTSCYGFVLKPYAKMHDGKTHRPVYLATDVHDFITAILEIIPYKPEFRSARTYEVEIDPLDHRSWLVRPVVPTIH
jgi:hypothetical protein